MKTNKIILTFGIIAVLIIISAFILTKPNVTAKNIDNNILIQNAKTIILKVNIPCSGHSQLIIDELKNAGIYKIDYQPISTFLLTYDSSKITKAEILALKIFKEYPAKEI